MLSFEALLSKCCTPSDAARIMELAGTNPVLPGIHEPVIFLSPKLQRTDAQKN